MYSDYEKHISLKCIHLWGWIMSLKNITSNSPDSSNWLPKVWFQWLKYKWIPELYCSTIYIQCMCVRGQKLWASVCWNNSLNFSEHDWLDNKVPVLNVTAIIWDFLVYFTIQCQWQIIANCSLFTLVLSVDKKRKQNLFSTLFASTWKDHEFYRRIYSI